VSRTVPVSVAVVAESCARITGFAAANNQTMSSAGIELRTK